MIELKHRTNINVLQVSDKPVIIYEDHRVLTAVLWHAKHKAKEPVGIPPLLVTFDRHDDAKVPTTSAMAQLKKFRTNPPNERDLFSFVEWELSVLDDDWLLAAMELGVVGDVINIGAEETPNLNGFETVYTDQQQTKHRIWQIPHIHSALGHQGALSDTHQEQFQPLWDALGWAPIPGPRDLNEQSGAAKIVLDFDLDCFAGELSGHTLAWPFDLIHERMNKRSSIDRTRGWSAKTLLGELEPRILFRTIALESPYCGGFHHSTSILAALDEILWDGEILRRYSEG